jgi:hypothetical protein
MKIMFVDDREEEINEIWKKTQLELREGYQLLPFEKFLSVERTCELVKEQAPDLVGIGFGLGIPGITGTHVFRALCEQGFNKKAIFGNSAGRFTDFVDIGLFNTGRYPEEMVDFVDKMAVELPLSSGDVARAIEVVAHPHNYRVSERLILAVLKFKKCPKEVIEAALEGFLKVKAPQGDWVHCLSHFNGILWERGMVEWIKRLNRAAFEGAIRVKDSNCCYRLVADFKKYATPSHNADDFGQSTENLQKIQALRR